MIVDMSSCPKLTKPYRNNIKFLETNLKKQRVLGEPLSELHNVSGFLVLGLDLKMTTILLI